MEWSLSNRQVIAMAQTLQSAWKANRHWVAAGFLGATALFLLLIFMSWRSEQRGIAISRATGLSAADSWSTQSMWGATSLLPSWPRKDRGTRISVDYVTSPKRAAGGSMGGAIDGVPRNAPRAAVYNSSSKASSEITERRVIRTGSLEIIARDPLQTAEQLRNLAVNSADTG